MLAALETARPFSHFTLQSNSRCSSVTHLRSIQLKDYHRTSLLFSSSVLFFFSLFFDETLAVAAVACCVDVFNLLACLCAVRGRVLCY
jgi:hypothetical protein